MKFAALVLLSCVLWEASGYPYPNYPFYANMDTLAYGASDSSRGGMVMNRYYNPYYPPQVGGGMAAFMFKQPAHDNQPSQYYMPEQPQQTPDPNFLPPPQENEVYYPIIPVAPEKPVTENTEIANPTEKNFQTTEIPSTTIRAVVPEIVEPEVEEVEEKPRRRVSKKKQVKRPPIVDEEDDEQPRIPSGVFFPMYFGWGRNGGGAPGGATAIANAYSDSRGGVASSHATAYGMPMPDFRTFKDHKTPQQQE